MGFSARRIGPSQAICVHILKFPERDSRPAVQLPSGPGPYETLTARPLGQTLTSYHLKLKINHTALARTQ